jgi:hypothetical protein
MTFNALGVTVMISGPGDTSKELEAVREVIRTWNSSHAEDEGVMFVAKHCSTDSVPIYSRGRDGQSVINDQITNKSDVIVALFKYRLGTPTPRNVHSGTVEEADILSPTGPVHFYFFESETLPAVISRDGTPEREQWGRLSAFREEFHQKNSGLYATYTGVENLKEQVEKALWSDARKFAASRLSSTPAPSATTPAKTTRLTVDVAGEVWHAPIVKGLVDAYIEDDVKKERERAADSPLRLSRTDERLAEWTTKVQDEMDDFDAELAAAAAGPISIHVKSDGLIEGLEIEFTFEKEVFGVDPTSESWKDIWTPFRAPEARDTLFPYMNPEIPNIDYRSLGPNRSFWGLDENDGVVLTAELEEIRKRSKPDVLEDSVILTLPYDSAAISEIRYTWHATARNPDAEWSGSGAIPVMSEDSVRTRIGAWFKEPGRD